MSRVFISFLGIGPDNQDGYKSLKYSYNDKHTGGQTEFVQQAEIEALGPATFDRIIILCTRESFDRFFHDLRDELVDTLKINPDKISCEKIESSLTPENQWQLFSIVNQSIQDGDQLVFDFTHGFRLLSIVLSTALHFILTSKPDVVLEHVFYGQQEENGTDGTIVDMKDFYTINEWSDGVSRLIDGADTSKLVTLVKNQTTGGSFSGIRNQELVLSLDHLTRVIKNVDTNHVASTCSKALQIIQKQKISATPEEKDLLELIQQTFKHLATSGEISGKYDRRYFEVQLNYARLLAKHGLYMQAFTVMRELIASIGMLGCTGKYKKPIMNSSDGIKYRRRFGDMFFNLCQFPKEKWKWQDPVKKKNIRQPEMDDFKNLLPFYEMLEDKGIAENLQAFTKELADYRNGFDHAWTGKSASFQEVSENAEIFLKKLDQVLEALKKHRIL
jgi:CRISPR-associated Csx2 family protein